MSEVEKHQIKITGVWIPGEVAFNNKLNDTDKFLFFYISSLDNNNGCFASNDYLASLMNVNNRTITRSITKLKELKYIYQESFDGRKRILRINLEYTKLYKQIRHPCLSRLDMSVEEIDNSLSKIDYTSPFSSEKGEVNPPEEDNTSPSVFVPEWIENILRLWDSLGLRKTPGINTKSYGIIVHNLKKLKRGIFFQNGLVNNRYKNRKFSEDDIKQAILNFSLAATNYDYEPSRKRYKEKLVNTYLHKFLYDDYLPTSNKSLFIYYLEQPPLSKGVVDAKLKNDSNPKLTRAIRKSYINKILSGIGPDNDRFPNYIENKFIDSAIKLSKFFDSNKRKINPSFIRGFKTKADLLIDSLSNVFGNNVEPGNLCSDYTFNKVLPSFLKEKAYVETDLI